MKGGVLAEAAITKYQRLDNFNERYLFPHSSRGREFKVRVLAWSVSGESALTHMWMAAFLSCSHMAFPLGLS